MHTAHADIGAELADLRTTTVGHAEALRTLELERCDRMVAGLWPQVEKGSPPAVTAAIRVGERRARLLGLDEPVVTKSELTGSLSVTAQKYAAERELFLRLDVQQLEALAAESHALVDKAMAMVKANALTPTPVTVRRAPMGHNAASITPGLKDTGPDVAGSGDGDRTFQPDGAHTSATPVLVTVSPSPAGGIDDVVTASRQSSRRPQRPDDDLDSAQAEPFRET